MDALPNLRRRLAVQGFGTLTDAEIKILDPWLRLVPFLTAWITALGTAMASARTLGVLAALAAVGVIGPRHPFDLLYHNLVRPLEGLPPLPATPRRRRAVYLLMCGMLAATSWCFTAGHAGWGYALGGFIAFCASWVAAFQTCFLSEALHRLFGTPGLREP